MIVRVSKEESVQTIVVADVSKPDVDTIHCTINYGEFKNLVGNVNKTQIKYRYASEENWQSSDFVRNFQLIVDRINTFRQCWGISDLGVNTIENLKIPRDNYKLTCNINVELDLNRLLSLFRLYQWHYGSKATLWNVFNVENFQQLKRIKNLKIFKHENDKNPIDDKIVQVQLQMADNTQDCKRLKIIFNCFDQIRQSLERFGKNKNQGSEYHVYRSMFEDIIDMTKDNNRTSKIVTHLIQHVCSGEHARSVVSLLHQLCGIV